VDANIEEFGAAHDLLAFVERAVPGPFRKPSAGAGAGDLLVRRRGA
jgi:hypothetical protein